MTDNRYVELCWSQNSEAIVNNVTVNCRSFWGQQFDLRLSCKTCCWTWWAICVRWRIALIPTGSCCGTGQEGKFSCEYIESTSSEVVWQEVPSRRNNTRNHTVWCIILCALYYLATKANERFRISYTVSKLFRSIISWIHKLTNVIFIVKPVKLSVGWGLTLPKKNSDSQSYKKRWGRIFVVYVHNNCT